MFRGNQQRCWVAVVVFLLLPLAPVVLAQEVEVAGFDLSPGKEKGFVALAAGQAKYRGAAYQDATNSFFLVRPFADSNFSIGAAIFNSQLSESSSSQQESPDGESERTVRVNIINHLAYGTMLGYNWSSESFFGFQFWMGGGYMSNQLELEKQTIKTHRRVNGVVSLCQGEATGQTKQVYSTPVFIGTGVTVRGFGIFIQAFRQSIPDLDVTSTSTMTCTALVEGDLPPDSFSDSHDTSLIASFTMVSTGIHYRF